MIIYSGDWHNRFKLIKEKIERLQLGNIEEITYIIQVGDFGIGFYPMYDMQSLEDLNNFFKEKNITCMVCRGNHDDPSFFNGDHIYSNLQLLPDYTVKFIDGQHHLFVGGAISINRMHLIREDQKEAALTGGNIKQWWKDEIFILDEKKLENLQNIDVVVSHIAPEYCYPDNRNGFNDFVDTFAENDPLLYDDLNTERADMTKMFEILERNGNWIKTHVYGHYHRSSITLNRYTTHYLLDINEFREI